MTMIPPPEYPAETKECVRCYQVKDLRDFCRNVKKKDGRANYCKKCGVARTTEWRDQGKKPGFLNIKLQKDEVKIVAAAFIENPNAGVRQISKAVGFSEDKIRDMIHRNEYLRALRTLAQGNIAGLIPKAVKGLDESLESVNADVKLKASVKVLENENVIGATRIDLTVTDLRSRPTSELQAIIAAAREIDSQTIIDAELIS